MKRVDSPTDVWAFGCRATSLSAVSNVCPAAAARFNGRHWVAMRLPGNDSISQVSALAPDDMWAANGPSVLSAENAPIRILHWNGTVWRAVPTQPNLPAKTELVAIAARSNTDIWIGGNAPAPKGKVRQLVWHWNGRSWANVSPPGQPSANNGLNGLVLDGAGGVFELVFKLEDFGGNFFSPIRHYSAGHWQAPFSTGWLVSQLAQVPGTTSVWGIGLSPKNGRGVIILHGPRPR
jgi:hypothetical protein